jgi:hypothetical protein
MDQHALHARTLTLDYGRLFDPQAPPEPRPRSRTRTLAAAIVRSLDPFSRSVHHGRLRTTGARVCCEAAR